MADENSLNISLGMEIKNPHLGIDMKTINKLIPGGELSLMPEGTYTDKEGVVRQSGAAVTIKFGKQFMRLRVDLARALYEGIRDDAEIRNFVGVD